VHDPDPLTAQSQLDEYRKLWSAFRKFEAMLLSPDTSKARKRQLTKLDADLYWGREPLVKEIGLAAEAQGWRVEGLKETAWHMFAPACNTKRTLEDTFSLIHNVTRGIPNKSVSRHRHCAHLKLCWPAPTKL
jgi:hypothetical protein